MRYLITIMYMYLSEYENKNVQPEREFSKTEWEISTLSPQLQPEG